MPFGNPVSFTTLSIKGPEPAEIPLTLLGPIQATGAISLFTAGPEAISATLWIGKDIDSSGNIPLYLETPWATGTPGGWTDNAGTTPLWLSGTLSYGTNSAVALSVAAPSTGITVGNVALVMPGAEYAYVSDEATIAVSGTLPTVGGGDPTGEASATTLLMPVASGASVGVPLYIDKGFGAIVPLTITSKIATGVVPISVDGASGITSTTSLLVFPPNEQTLTIFTRGFNDG